jgi:hypothetical protein
MAFFPVSNTCWLLFFVITWGSACWLLSMFDKFASCGGTATNSRSLSQYCASTHHGKATLDDKNVTLHCWKQHEKTHPSVATQPQCMHTVCYMQSLQLRGLCLLNTAAVHCTVESTASETNCRKQLHLVFQRYAHVYGTWADAVAARCVPHSPLLYTSRNAGLQPT